MAFTKVVGPGIHSASNVHTHNINSAGIITATQFDGPFSNIVVGGATTLTVDGINISAGILTAKTLDLNGNGDISGNLVLGGDLTVNGTTTTLDTNLVGVDRVEIGAAGAVVGLAVTQSGSADLVRLYDGSTQVVTVDDEGKVGIGTISPDHNLHVHNSSGDSIVTIESTGNDKHSALEFIRTSSGGDSKGAGSIYVTGNTSASEGVMKFAVGHNVAHEYTPSMVIMGNGEVGIGTDNPTNKFEVYGTTKTQQLNVTGVSTYTGLVDINGGATVNGGLTSTLLTINGGASPATINHTGGNALTLARSSKEISFNANYAASNTYANMSVTSGMDLRFTVGGRDGITIDGSNGYMGIDTNAPTAPLHIASNSASVKITRGGKDFTFNANYGASNTYMLASITSGMDLRLNLGGSDRIVFKSAGHIEPITAGAMNIGSASKEIGDIYFANSKGLKLGSSQVGDLYNDGTDTYFRNSVSNGQTLIRSGGNIWISDYSGNHRAAFRDNSSVDLYFDIENNATAKLSTTVKGISVHGEVEASQDFPITKPVLDFNFAAEKKLDPRFTFYRRGTASYVDKKGIIRYASSNEPRFDHHPTTGASLGLLLEKQQSNYQPYSVDMSQGGNNNAVTVINDAAISPDGTKNASKIIGSDNQSTSQRLGWGTQTVPNSSYTMWSIWLKSEETSCIIQVYSNTYTFGADHLNVELADGTTGGHDNNDGTFRYNLEKYPNKWWRLSWGGNGNGGTGGMYVAVVPSISSTRAANTGAAHSKVWYAWGLQEEVSTESRIATSYIPTYGAAATRYGEHVQMQDDDFDDFFDRFQGTIINEHSNALQSYTGGGSAWEFNNDQFQTNIVTQTGSGYSHTGYPGAHASIFGDRGSNGSGNGSGSDYIQGFGPNFADGLNQATSTGNGRFPHNNIPDYTRYYKTWIDGMSYDLTPSTNILRTASGGEAASDTTNTQNISLHNISKLEIGGGATDKAYADFYGRIKRWVYYDKVVTQNQLANLTAQLPQSYL